MLYEGTDHWQITVNHTHILAGSNHSLQARLYLSRTHHKLQYASPIHYVYNLDGKMAICGFHLYILHE